MLQIMYHGIIHSLKIRFDLSQLEIDKMFDIVYSRINYCAYCRNKVDKFRSGFMSSIEKERRKSLLPYFHPNQILSCVCTSCNGFCMDTPPNERTIMFKSLRLQNTHNGVLDFSIICNELDNIRKKYNTWSNSKNITALKHNCSEELMVICMEHSGKKQAIYNKFKSMEKQNKLKSHKNDFTSYQQLVEILLGFGGKCCAIGIPITSGNCKLGFDRRYDNLNYNKKNVWVLYEGTNQAKNCGNQGKNNNMFQDEATFSNFVKQHGNDYGLKQDDELEDNQMKYIRHFIHGLIENYEKIDWSKYELSQEESKQLQLVQQLQLAERHRIALLQQGTDVKGDNDDHDVEGDNYDNDSCF